MNVLVSGVGNELKGDDAFGIHAARRLSTDPRKPENCIVQQTGIGGIHLVQELMRGYELLILFDAFDRGGAPGDLWLLEPDLPKAEEMTHRERRDYFADVHYATPDQGVDFGTVGRSAAVNRTHNWLSACNLDAFDTEMDSSVANAIPKAVDLAIEVMSNLHFSISKKPEARAFP